MTDPTDRDLLRRLREGNPEAWRTLYDQSAERIWRGVARLVGPSSADVADIVQETMLAAARSVSSFNPERGTLWAWIWGIARLQVALHFRKQRRHGRFEAAKLWLAHHHGSLARWLEGSEPDPALVFEATELATLVRLTLTELSADHEAVLTAKYLEGDSIEEIAERERSSNSAIRSKLARAREAFRQAFTRLSPTLEADAEACHEPR